MRRISTLIIIIALCIISIVMVSCSASNTDSAGNTEPASLPVSTNMAGNATSSEVCNALSAAGLSNVAVFNDWVMDFAGVAGTDAGLTDEWISPDLLQPDTAKCMDGWEHHYDHSDSDCRMTAMLLLDGIVTADSTGDEYDGTYLMFDVDAIDNVPKYEVIRKNRDLFTALFGETTPEKGEDPAVTFGRKWKESGFRILSEKASLLSIVIYDPDFDTTFVGHTGILIDEGDSVLFVEKLAFEQPYQATRAEDLDQLLSILSERPEYFGGEDDIGPFVYLNGEYQGEL